jgi:hypothetical protein
MTVELDGNVRMRGDAGPGLGVRVLAEQRRLRLVSGNDLVGDWSLSDIGISALQDGFNIRAEGEEFVLRTEDDVALAEEIGITAASPRLARRLAASHNREQPPAVEAPVISSNLAAIGFALAGALVILGGTLLEPEAFRVAFVIGGVLMIAIAYVMSIGAKVARVIATVTLVGLIAVFGFAVSGSPADQGDIAAYGFIAGGLVVGIAVLASGSLRQPG